MPPGYSASVLMVSRGHKKCGRRRPTTRSITTTCWGWEVPCTVGWRRALSAAPSSASGHRSPVFKARQALLSDLVANRMLTMFASWARSAFVRCSASPEERSRSTDRARIAKYLDNVGPQHSRNTFGYGLMSDDLRFGQMLPGALLLRVHQERTKNVIVRDTPLPTPGADPAEVPRSRRRVVGGPVHTRGEPIQQDIPYGLGCAFQRRVPR